MKNKSTHLLLSVLFSLTSLSVYAQQFYVVVGTFTVEKGAQKFAGYVRSKLVSADFEMEAQKKYYYVYALKTPDRKFAVAETRRVQRETEFKDVWLYSDKTGRVNLDAKIEETPPPIETPIAPKVPKPMVASPIDTSRVIPPVIVTTPTEEKIKGKLFKFTIQTGDRKPIHATHGEIHDVNYSLGNHLASYKSDEYIDLPAPKENSPMTFVCGIFGYKEVVKVIDYDNPQSIAGAKKDDKGAWVVPYQLERMKKGDVSVMYHVYFHKDAVIMLPEAKTEMDELVSMMNDNLHYKIKIHSHCNGNYPRRIIALGKTKNYFDVKGSTGIQGTAKELSKLRAEAVKSYLADNGIDQNRSEIFPWGALNMLVPETSTSAKLNDRIEIEIEED